MTEPVTLDLLVANLVGRLTLLLQEAAKSGVPVEQLGPGSDSAPLLAVMKRLAQSSVTHALDNLARDPGNIRLQIALRVRLKEALEGDPRLASDVRDLAQKTFVHPLPMSAPGSVISPSPLPGAARAGVVDDLKPPRPASFAPPPPSVEDYSVERRNIPEDRQSQLKLLIARGKEQGYLTYAQVNDHLPLDIVDAEQIEDIVNTINDVGIPVYEKAPDTESLLASDYSAPADEEAIEDAAAALATLEAELDRTADPARMYMRETGSEEAPAPAAAPPSPPSAEGFPGLAEGALEAVAAQLEAPAPPAPVPPPPASVESAEPFEPLSPLSRAVR